MKPLQNDLILMTFPLFTSESRQWAICRHSWLSKSWEHDKQTGPLSLNRGYPKNVFSAWNSQHIQMLKRNGFMHVFVE